ncbi:MAG: hypothetical protein P9M06_05680 [Candidatus Saelkia tenebricola]|nr:hypothetical protein [Candidatus Saelkia tenebricola]
MKVFKTNLKRVKEKAGCFFVVQLFFYSSICVCAWAVQVFDDGSNIGGSIIDATIKIQTEDVGVQHIDADGTEEAVDISYGNITSSEVRGVLFANAATISDLIFNLASLLTDNDAERANYSTQFLNTLETWNASEVDRPFLNHIAVRERVSAMQESLNSEDSFTGLYQSLLQLQSEFNGIIQDVRNGNLTDDIKQVLFDELVFLYPGSDFTDTLYYSAFLDTNPFDLTTESPRFLSIAGGILEKYRSFFEESAGMEESEKVTQFDAFLNELVDTETYSYVINALLKFDATENYGFIMKGLFNLLPEKSECESNIEMAITELGFDDLVDFSFKFIKTQNGYFPAVVLRETQNGYKNEYMINVYKEEDNESMFDVSCYIAPDIEAEEWLMYKLNHFHPNALVNGDAILWWQNYVRSEEEEVATFDQLIGNMEVGISPVMIIRPGDIDNKSMEFAYLQEYSLFLNFWSSILMTEEDDKFSLFMPVSKINVVDGNAIRLSNADYIKINISPVLLGDFRITDLYDIELELGYSFGFNSEGESGTTRSIAFRIDVSEFGGML